DRTQEGVGGAEALPVALGDLGDGRTVLLGAVVVGGLRDAGRLAGLQEAPVHRPRRALLADAQRTSRAVELRRSAHVVLGLHEIRQHVAVAPAGSALGLPGVVVQRAPPDVEHRVHRAATAEHLPARYVARAVVHVR